MGISISTRNRAEKQFLSRRSNEIDKQIEEDARRIKHEHKVLLLGVGRSGKSALVKRMKIAYDGRLPDDELAQYRCAVYKRLLDSAHQVITYIRKTGLKCLCDSDGALVRKVLDYQLDIDSNAYLSFEIAEAIHQLWNDPILAKIMAGHFGGFYLVDSADYFLSNVLRIGASNYLPNEQDALMIEELQQEHAGVVETIFRPGSLTIRICDVGSQRTERRKWIHHFEAATSIMFVAALDEYDQGLLEDEAIVQNRLAESLVLFESVANSRWFLRTSIILLLNKIDIFREKIPKVPLERYFPEYTGGADVNKAAKFILWKFMQGNRVRLSVYPHLTHSTDSTAIRLLFAAVKETIKQNRLKDTGIL